MDVHPPRHNSQTLKIRPIKYLQSKAITPQNIVKYQVYHPKNLKTSLTPPFNYGDQSKLSSRKPSKVLEAQNIVSDACHYLNDTTSFQNNYFSSRIKNVSSSLASLQLEAWNHMNETRSRVIFKSLGSLKKLKEVDLTFFFCRFPVTNDLHFLLKRLLYFKNLNHFSFSATSSKGFEHTHFKALCSVLMRSSQLHSLKLVLDCHDQFTGLLILALSKLTNLTKVDLSLQDGHPIRAENMLKLLLTLGSIKTLTDITLYLYCPIITENINIEPWRGLEYLNTSSIRKLRFGTYKNLTKEGLIQVLQALEKFSSLQVFNLNLPDSQEIFDKDLMQLSSTIMGLKSLISLTLRFPSFTENLALAISSLRNLVDLKLYFQNLNISPENVDLLASGLRSLKSSLKFLELGFAQYSSFSDSMIKSLANAIQELNLLNHLSLSFIANSRITSEGVEALSSAVQRLANLSSLSLTFMSIQEIDERAVSYLSQILRSLPSLYSLDLNLMYCPKISSKEDSFEGLFAVLCETRNLLEISLAFPLCCESSAGVIKLKKRFDLYISKDSSALRISSV